MRVGGLAVLVATAALAAASAAAAPRLQHVTLISDSVAGAFGWDPPAARILEQGLAVDLELAGCRRLTTESCPAGGIVPPNALTLIRSLGARLGPNVVIAVGYNDYPSVYGPGIEQTLAALRQAHVQRVFWLTLAASQHPYLLSNAEIWAAARRHAGFMTVIDWNAYARGHPEWFQPDGVHLQSTGAEALARCIHDALVRAGVHGPAAPLLDISLRFPAATVVPGFHAQLRATGGAAPYRFSVRGLPAGLHAQPDGAIGGLPGSAGAYPLTVTVTDGRGRAATVELTLRVG